MSFYRGHLAGHHHLSVRQMVSFLSMTHSWGRANRQVVKVKHVIRFVIGLSKGEKISKREPSDRPNEGGGRPLIKSSLWARCYVWVCTYSISCHPIFLPTKSVEFFILTLLYKTATEFLFNSIGTYFGMKHVIWGKTHQPHLCRTVESGPSGCLQLAPLTGNHQGAAATSKQPRISWG